MIYDPFYNYRYIVISLIGCAPTKTKMFSSQGAPTQLSTTLVDSNTLDPNGYQLIVYDANTSQLSLITESYLYNIAQCGQASFPMGISGLLTVLNYYELSDHSYVNTQSVSSTSANSLGLTDITLVRQMLAKYPAFALVLGSSEINSRLDLINYWQYLNTFRVSLAIDSFGNVVPAYFFGPLANIQQGLMTSESQFILEGILQSSILSGRSNFLWLNVSNTVTQSWASDSWQYENYGESSLDYLSTMVASEDFDGKPIFVPIISSGGGGQHRMLVVIDEKRENIEFWETNGLTLDKATEVFFPSGHSYAKSEDFVNALSAEVNKGLQRSGATKLNVKNMSVDGAPGASIRQALGTCVSLSDFLLLARSRNSSDEKLREFFANFMKNKKGKSLEQYIHDYMKAQFAQSTGKDFADKQTITQYFANLSDDEIRKFYDRFNVLSEQNDQEFLTAIAQGINKLAKASKNTAILRSSFGLPADTVTLTSILAISQELINPNPPAATDLHRRLQANLKELIDSSQTYPEVRDAQENLDELFSSISRAVNSEMKSIFYKASLIYNSLPASVHKYRAGVVGLLASDEEFAAYKKFVDTSTDGSALATEKDSVKSMMDKFLALGQQRELIGHYFKLMDYPIKEGDLVDLRYLSEKQTTKVNLSNNLSPEMLDFLKEFFPEHHAKIITFYQNSKQALAKIGIAPIDPTRPLPDMEVEQDRLTASIVDSISHSDLSSVSMESGDEVHQSGSFLKLGREAVLKTVDLSAAMMEKTRPTEAHVTSFRLSDSSVNSVCVLKAIFGMDSQIAQLFQKNNDTDYLVSVIKYYINRNRNIKN